MNVYIWKERPIYDGEYIEYKMNADSNGRLYVPTGGYSFNASFGNSYSWKVSVDGGTETTYTGSASANSSITLSGYTAGSSHTIKIVPTTEDYAWARAYGWRNTAGRTYLTEIIYDSSYMGFASSATDTGDYFRFHEYSGCTNLINSPEEYMPNTVTSIGSYFRGYQYYQCESLTNIKGWYDLSIGNSNYRRSQYSSCISNKTVKVLSDVGYDSYSLDTLDNTYVTSVSVPSDYLNNFKSTSNLPWDYIDDSKFIGY